MMTQRAEIEGLFIVYCAAMRVKNLPAWALEPGGKYSREFGGPECVGAWRVACNGPGYRIEELYNTSGVFIYPFGEDWIPAARMWEMLRFAVDSLRERAVIAGEGDAL